MNTTEVNYSNTASLNVENLKILLLGFGAFELGALRDILKKEGRTLVSVGNSIQALEVAMSSDIAAIVMDTDSSTVDLGETIISLKENPSTKDIPVVFLNSTETTVNTISHYNSDDSFSFLNKPIDARLLKDYVGTFEKMFHQRKELNSLNERLLKANKQLDEFFYIVSHDLKAPLRGMSSLCSFIEDEIESPTGELSQLLSLMRNRLGRIQGLMDGILHYSRLGNLSGPKESVDTKQLIINIIDLITPSDNITVEFPDTMPVLQTEAVKLHEVFQNLILNGIKYNNKEKGLIRISFLDYPKHIEFCVEDNGIGIKEDHFEKIFQLFQTLVSKDKDESTGLGLTIVRKLVEQQGGQVFVESTFGEGSKFKFTWFK